MAVIVWDEPKRRINLAKHRLDFADLTGDFFLGALIVPAKLGRPKAMGRFADGTIAVIFATLGAEGISILSMRPASRLERRLYDARKDDRRRGSPRPGDDRERSR